MKNKARDKSAPGYWSWISMRQRCLNPSCKDFKRYGGRGISICESWNSFEVFIKDMGSKPEGTTLDRIDNSKGYNKENCKWSDAKQQARNRRSNRFLKFQGKEMIMSEWTDYLNFPRGLIANRLSLLGWSVKRALSTPHIPVKERQHDQR